MPGKRKIECGLLGLGFVRGMREDRDERKQRDAGEEEN